MNNWKQWSKNYRARYYAKRDGNEHHVINEQLMDMGVEVTGDQDLWNLCVADERGQRWYYHACPCDKCKGKREIDDYVARRDYERWESDRADSYDDDYDRYYDRYDDDYYDRREHDYKQELEDKVVALESEVRFLRWYIRQAEEFSSNLHHQIMDNDHLYNRDMVDMAFERLNAEEDKREWINGGGEYQSGHWYDSPTPPKPSAPKHFRQGKDGEWIQVN
tara:strand:+ start:1491 stop:2150 length:660 start_codon:yes stop_codon:yes gene_type:complete